MDNDTESRRRHRSLSFQGGPYVLRKVLEDIPLLSEDSTESISITCVEYWNDNLYIGTSASELLHLVAIPSESEDDPPIFILASRLQPNGHSSVPPHGQETGVQQILVLPGPLKACVLCNGVVSFYTLPELTPASPSKPPTGVQWIGGIDENEGRDDPSGQVVMIASSKRILLVKVGERLRQVKVVDYPGCLRSSRRETIACVANGTSYALLEVEHQQQIPLFPISSSAAEEVPAPQQIPPGGHNRSTSLGIPNSSHERQQSTPVGGPNLEVPNVISRVGSPVDADSSRNTGRPRSSTEVLPPKQTVKYDSVDKMKPHVVSPNQSEFMLTTGTTKTERGVGMFVNLDGDVVPRGTIEFDRYPDALMVYSFDNGDIRQQVLALMDKFDVSNGGIGLEIQDISEAVDSDASKSWLPLPDSSVNKTIGGLHQCLSAHRYSFTEVTKLLQAARLKLSTPHRLTEPDPRTRTSIEQVEQETALFENQSPPMASPTLEYEQTRTEEEKRFVARLGHSTTKAVVWSGGSLWQILQNPLLLQLEHRLNQTGIAAAVGYSFESLDVSRLLSLLGSIREQDPQSEADFRTLTYIRQKSSLILFLHIQKTMQTQSEIESTCQLARNALLEGLIDPRVILSLTQPLAREVVQGPNGIWINQGLLDLINDYDLILNDFQSAPIPFWLMIRHFLSDWQEKRGYGSISDEKFVFDTVDAALLHLLLYLDKAFSEGSGLQTATRAKLNNVVDHWKGDFDRAITLLERYRRLYLLSRLYQSRKMAKNVLATWKRIAEGEQDDDTSVTIGTVELQIRRYLTKFGNANLVEEYGLWLAKRNPDLAVQLFADDSTRVKLTPAEVVSMLKDQAPGAVQQYLEHLVFSKHLDQYADDLIGYYLDSVLNVLETNQNARESLDESYTTYRALEPPRPTYLSFITQNAPPEPWWQSRLRLLQLLGSGGYATTSSSDKPLTYSVDMVLERLAPFSSSLVSESIILDARQGRHREALRLLVHGLGDYDSSVRYCYFGGPAPPSSQPIDASLLPSREVQQDLFTYLFHEFLQIKDVEERIDRTSHLLGTFATWFDPLTIFSDIPEDWTVDMLSEFLLRSLRAATSVRNQALIVKALSAAQNLQQQATFIEACEKLGPHIEMGTNASESEVDQGIV